MPATAPRRAWQTPRCLLSPTRSEDQPAAYKLIGLAPLAWLSRLDPDDRAKLPTKTVVLKRPSQLSTIRSTPPCLENVPGITVNTSPTD